MADAHDVDAALARFKRLILRLREQNDFFDEVERVDLEACIEIRSVPRDGFLAFYNLLEGEDRGGIFDVDSRSHRARGGGVPGRVL